MQTEMMRRIMDAIQHSDVDESDREYIARDVLEAMREPTEEMLVAAYRAVGVPEKPILRYAFNAMIDAALTPSTPA